MKIQCFSCQISDSDQNIRHGYHAECSKKLFGDKIPPKVPFSTPDILSESLKMVGKMSVSGVQPKLSAVHNRKKRQLVVVKRGGLYILKPQTDLFLCLPENENLCMCIASVCGIDVPSHGLLPLTDNRFAYVVKRFDRTEGGFKFEQEDFQQLLDIRDKYDGSYERIANFIKKNSDDPGADLMKLYERALLFFILGNGDAHLKNFSLIRTREAGYHLSPAYDIVSSKLVLPDEREETCLSLQGKRNRISKKDFIRLSAHFGLDREQTDSVLSRLNRLKSEIEMMIQKSFLPEQLKTKILEIFGERMKRLFG
ncbi:type II toxin-antitoxin system HipA family toxin [Desulfonema magnum]|uniref:HipA-like C-terminal domain-containing protein n=1 Tax=Desulfonema magnum TaxID=45655 RepID=A0A975BSW4_9BACT|nr:HipA domain-containing protein [Desulfonema magnum]QTA90872.1 HipA-like C-terminal domain-containing protein [Desulfonema magnum]